MTIANILKHKGRLIEAAQPDATVKAAAERMNQKGVGCLIIREDEGPVQGILSKGDLVRGMAMHGPAVFNLPIRQLMTVKVWACAPDDGVKKAMEIMTNRRIRHLPVMDGDELRGLVSISDVVNLRLGKLKAADLIPSEEKPNSAGTP